MNTFIFGVGRSGTTMTYGLIQKMFSRQFPGGYRSTYEPFIWDREKFNCSYQEATKFFGKTSSLSIEGIYHHLQMPLFVESANARQYLDSDFLSHFREVDTPHVAKFIRGNGRMALLRALNPSAKFVLIVRNPVDVINSAKDKFAFYGDDFYPSDFPRFCRELASSGKLILTQESSTWAEQQGEYCYQMCQAALEFAARDDNTWVLEYEKILTGSPQIVAQLCRFLNTEFDEGYAQFLEKPVGPTTRAIMLSPEEFKDILPYDQHYRALLSKYSISASKARKDILNEYEGKCLGQPKDISLEGVTTNRLRNVIRKRDRLITQLKTAAVTSTPPGV